NWTTCVIAQRLLVRFGRGRRGYAGLSQLRILRARKDGLRLPGGAFRHLLAPHLQREGVMRTTGGWLPLVVLLRRQRYMSSEFQVLPVVDLHEGITLGVWQRLDFSSSVWAFDSGDLFANRLAHARTNPIERLRPCGRVQSDA